MKVIARMGAAKVANARSCVSPEPRFRIEQNLGEPTSSATCALTLNCQPALVARRNSSTISFYIRLFLLLRRNGGLLQIAEPTTHHTNVAVSEATMTLQPCCYILRPEALHANTTTNMESTKYMIGEPDAWPSYCVVALH